MDRGLVQVYTGDGKGKTTAALGLALRAAGWGLRVYVLQFLKGRETGELRAARMLRGRLTIQQAGSPRFVVKPTRGDRELAQAGLRKAMHAMKSGEYDIVILDEVFPALNLGLVSLEQVLGLLVAKPPGVELVLTGRGAPKEVVERADLVTEMREIKHPFRSGVGARRGIEF